MGALSCGWFWYDRLPIRRATLSVAEVKQEQVTQVENEPEHGYINSMMLRVRFKVHF